MKEKKISPLTKMALELGPIVLFFVAYLRLKDQTIEIMGHSYSGFIVATGLFIPILLVSMVILKILSGELSRMQIISGVLVVIFGGLTVWLNNELFFKMKPTILYLFFSGYLGVSLMRSKNGLQYVLEGLLPMTEEGWAILTKRFCVFFLALAIANEIVWRTMSTDVWVYFKLFGLTSATFIFLLAQTPLIHKHGLEDEK